MEKINTILLVEDNPLDAELTLEALKEPAIAENIVLLRDGVEALDYLFCREKYADRLPKNPGLILLDLKMPKLNGLEVLRTIKGTEKLKSIPVIMLTSSKETPDLKESYRLGVNAYVVKPVDYEQFANEVKTLGLFWGKVNKKPPE